MTTHASTAETSERASEPSTTAADLSSADRGREALIALLACVIMQLPTWGFAVSFGIFQTYYTSPEFHVVGSNSSLSAIGPVLNGVNYLSMPFLFGILSQNSLSGLTDRSYRTRAQLFLAGIFLSTTGLLASGFAKTAWQLICTQAILQGFGSSLLYSASTIYIDEWYVQRKGYALGVTLASKSAIGATMPIAFSLSLNKAGYKITLLIWTAVVMTTSVIGFFMLRPLRRPHQGRGDGLTDLRAPRRCSRKIGWSFLQKKPYTFPLHLLANTIFSASYGIPQTYLPSFAAGTLGLSPTTAAIFLVIFNIASTPASIFFGLLSDDRSLRLPGFRTRKLRIGTVTALSTIGSALPIICFWGLVPTTGLKVFSIVLLALFSVTWGFFAGGYSATWAGIIRAVDQEAHARDDMIDTGLLLGLLNGGRGVGYIVGGLAGVELLAAGGIGKATSLAYGSGYGGLILFSGCGAVLSSIGGLAVSP